jgi:hypothetical protein
VQAAWPGDRRIAAAAKLLHRDRRRAPEPKWRSEFARSSRNAPESRIFAAAKIEAAWEIATEERRPRPTGGITLENVRAYAETGADFVSSGAITHSAPAVDISFRLDLV